ncbi:MAG: hypothetical protein CMK59_15150 [Proteobacteria bacterium]|nr:hypothetical protein [Pseudomonadota bacterium]
MWFFLSCIHQKVPDPVTNVSFEVEATFTDIASKQAQKFFLTVLLEPIEQKNDGSFVLSAQMNCRLGKEQNEQYMFPQFRIFPDAELLAVVQKVDFSTSVCPDEMFDVFPALLFPNPPTLSSRQERVSSIRWSGFNILRDDKHLIRATWQIEQSTRQEVQISYEGQWVSKGASGSFEAPYEGSILFKKYGGLPEKHEAKSIRKICFERDDQNVCSDHQIDLILSKVQ